MNLTQLNRALSACVRVRRTQTGNAQAGKTCREDWNGSGLGLV
jgi:hypothetical protein